MGENFAALPVAVYGAVLLFAGFAYFILTRALISSHAKDSALATACSFLTPWVACALYVLVAIMWFIPDRRIEKALVERIS